MKALVLAAILTLAAAGEEPSSTASIEETGLRQLRALRRVLCRPADGWRNGRPDARHPGHEARSRQPFILTENPDRADATLRGAAEDLVFTEVHNSSDSLNAHTNFASGRTTRRTGGSYKGIGIGENKSEHSAERCHPAMAAVHLGNNEGDVIWSTTQEEPGR
jgi:hypothetical protein